MLGVIILSEQLNCGSQQLFGPAINTQPWQWCTGDGGQEFHGMREGWGIVTLLVNSLKSQLSQQPGPDVMHPFACVFFSLCNMKYAFKHESLGRGSPLHCAAPSVSLCPCWGVLCQISFAQELLLQQYLWNSPSTACTSSPCTLIPSILLSLWPRGVKSVPTLTFCHGLVNWQPAQAELTLPACPG